MLTTAEPVAKLSGGKLGGGARHHRRQGQADTDTELAAVEVIADRSTDGRLLAIDGPPGIGKTALLVRARSLAQGYETGTDARESLGTRRAPSEANIPRLEGLCDLGRPAYPGRVVSQRPPEE